MEGDGGGCRKKSDKTESVLPTTSSVPLTPSTVMCDAAGTLYTKCSPKSTCGWQKCNKNVAQKPQPLHLHIVNPGVEFPWRKLRYGTLPFRWEIHGMKKLLLVTILGTLLSVAGGCRWMECMWRGGPPNQTCQPATTVTCPSPCATSGGCESCGGGSAVVSPGPTYATPGTRP